MYIANKQLVIDGISIPAGSAIPAWVGEARKLNGLRLGSIGRAPGRARGSAAPSPTPAPTASPADTADPEADPEAAPPIVDE